MDYIKGTFKGVLTRETLLLLLSEEEIFEMYLGIYPQMGREYKSPFRNDNRAGCKFYRDKRGVLKFRDVGRCNIDCFNVVQNRFGLNYNEALHKIAADFGIIEDELLKNKPLAFSPIRNYVAPEKMKIRYAIRPWDAHSILMWSKLGLSRGNLEYYGIHSLQTAWLEDSYGHLSKIYSHTANDLGYVYIFTDNSVQLYFPYRRKSLKAPTSPRFMLFAEDKTGLMGWDKIPDEGDLCLITKSYKDVVTLGGLRVPAVSPYSEVTGIDIDLIADLQRRYTYVISLYDFDYVGVTNANALRRDSNVEALFLTNGRLGTKNYKAKDPSDYYLVNGKSQAERLIRQLKEHLSI